MCAMEKKDEGNEFLRRGDYGDAIRCYTEGLELEPGNHLLLSNRSAAYLRMGEASKALADANACISSKSDWPKGYVRRVNVLMTQVVETLKKGRAVCGDDPLFREEEKKISDLVLNQGPSAARFSSPNTADSAHGRVVLLKTESEFEELTKSPGLTVVDFFAQVSRSHFFSPISLTLHILKWCGPCKMVAPQFIALSGQFPDVNFAKVDTDNPAMRQIMMNCGVNSMPTFKFFMGGTMLSQSVRGADIAAVTNLIQRLKSGGVY